MTLDLVNDSLRFVIASFEIISASAPHIYHSAILLSPQTSIIRKLYKTHASPFVRIIQGLPVSWEPIVLAPEPYATIVATAWSPCSRFIAVSRSYTNTTEILDSVTLERLTTFGLPHKAQWISFSSDSHLLTQVSSKWELTSWDLQTGGPVSTIPSEPDMSGRECFSLTHSMDGKMVAVAYWDSSTTVTTGISTYDLSSKRRIYSHHVSEGRIVAPIWTLGEYVQFVTVKPGSITIWKVRFTSIFTLVEVESLPAPDNTGRSGECLFHPTLSRLAFASFRTGFIWDAQSSKLLLNFISNGQFACGDHPKRMSFSSDGHIFAYRTPNQGVHLWKESPTGYILQKSIPSPEIHIGPLLSPGGESIIIPYVLKIQLWHMEDPAPPISSTEPTKRASFILEFSPDKTLAAVARLGEKTAIVLDIESGNPWLTINMGMEIVSLGITESTIVIVGGGWIVTWNLPQEDHTSNTRLNVGDGIQATTLGCSAPLHPVLLSCTSISPDLKYIAMAESTPEVLEILNIYNLSTGKHLTGVKTEAWMPWFTPDGCEVWCKGAGFEEGWTITKDTESDLIKLEPLGPTAHPLGGFPWQSCYGFEIAQNGWILDSCGKRLLWLPRHWRLGDMCRKWSGQFLGLLNDELLPEAVILECKR